MSQRLLDEVISTFIQDLKKLGGPTHQQVMEASYIYNTYLASGQWNEETIWRIAKAIAVLSFRPSGIVFNNRLYIQNGFD